MQKLKGWTMAKFVGCEHCPTRGRKIVCQATGYSISRKNGVWRSKNYCPDCAHEVIKHHVKKPKPTAEEKQKEQADYEYMQSRDWYNNSSASCYF